MEDSSKSGNEGTEVDESIFWKRNGTNKQNSERIWRNLHDNKEILPKGSDDTNILNRVMLDNVKPATTIVKNMWRGYTRGVQLIVDNRLVFVCSHT